MEASLQERTDAGLVTAVRTGNRRAYGALIHRHTGRVYGVCLGILGEPAAAEDIVQETFARGLTQIDKLRDGGDFAQWITQISRNLCRDEIKTACRRRELLEANPVDHRPESNDFTDLYRALGRLTREDRLSLALYYLDGYNISGVAEELGVSENAAYTRLSRARRALRSVIEEMDSK